MQHAFKHISLVPAQLRREMTKFEVDLRTGTARRSILLSLPDLNSDAVPSLQF